MIRPTRETLSGWGESVHAESWVYRPRSAAEVRAAVLDARDRGLTLTHRGAGLSYGDAALNEGGAVVVLDRLDSVIDLDPATGTVRVEAGVTIEDLWKASIGFGWWPPVVPGSMKATVGGCVAMDVHGKNHVASGSFGEHVEALTLLEPGGEVVRIDRETEGGLDRVIGAQGLTGSILDVTLRLKRVRSGYLEVEALPTPGLEATLDALGAGAEDAEYAVAWIDCFPSGARAGRGLLHFGRHVGADHQLAGRGLDVDAQALPRRILGVVPRRHAWRGLRVFTHDPGIRLTNAVRYYQGRLLGGRRYAQSHAAFHFLLDYVPGWKRAYGPRGLIQYQMFVPRDAAAYAFGEALRLQRELGVYSYLAVAKRHWASRFAARYALDGFSLAMDFPVAKDRVPLERLCASYGALLGEVGGRIYAAKDAVGVGELPEERAEGYTSDLVRRWGMG